MKSLIIMALASFFLASCRAAANPVPATQVPAVLATEIVAAAPAASPTANPATAGMPASTPEPASSPQSAAIAAIPFDLGDAALVQADFVPEAVRQMPVRLNGLLAVPPTGENLPLAVMIHGSHGSGCASDDGMTEDWPCPAEEKQHFAGFAYLLEALAEQGYAAVAINANPAYVNAFGEANTQMRIPSLFDLYMQQLVQAAQGAGGGFGVDLAGRIDFSQIVLVGHSQGGAGVDAIMAARVGNTSTAEISAGQGPITAAVLVAPAGTSDRDRGLSGPAAVILPACDRDLRGLDGQTYYERERLKADQPHLIISILLQWANHNRFNTSLPDEALAIGFEECTPDRLLAVEAQHEFLAEYVPSFFDHTLGRALGGEARLGLDVFQPAPGKLLGREVLTSLALPSELRLRLPLTPEGASGSAEAIDCPSEFTDEGGRKELCRYLNISQPGSPEFLAVTWNGAGSAYEIQLTDGYRDLSGYQSVHLRAVIDPLSALNQPGKPQAFSLRLTDGSGQASTVTLAGEPALAFPYGTPVTFEDQPDTLIWDNNVLLSSVRVPLDRFTGIDLADIRSVALVFDQTESGAIFVTDLEFLQAIQNNKNGTNMMEIPEPVMNLEAAYGAPSQAAFGSAVFFEQLQASDDLKLKALEKYRYFVGALWEQYGEQAWMGPWREVYARQPGTPADIVAELRGISDREAQLSIPMILDSIAGAEQARAALSAVYDDPAMVDLQVYNLGDSGAMSGIMIIGRRSDGATIYLIFLYD